MRRDAPAASLVVESEIRVSPTMLSRTNCKSITIPDVAIMSDTKATK